MLDWAVETCRRELAQELPRRWAHVCGVARRAEELKALVGEDAELLRAAAVLHDIGYAPRLVVSGFHPLDGARHLLQCDAPHRLADLVAHHSGAAIEARIRGLDAELREFRDECSPLRDALWYCDLTTSPDGERVAVADRLTEIRQRYGPDAVVTRFVDEAEDELLAVARRTQERIDSLETQPR